MKVLFLDDSYHKVRKYIGSGGFCLDARSVRPLSDDLCDLKRKYRIPYDVEIKWSPPPNHYFRTKFRGSRSSLYRDAIALLAKHNAHLLCVVHGLKHCYGVKMHNWRYEKARRWVVAEQLKFLAERFQKTYLEPEDKHGFIVSDSYASREGEDSIINSVTSDVLSGTFFQKLDRIALSPLMTDSKYCFPVQIADIVVGIVVSYLTGGQYAVELIDCLAPLFAFNPHPGSVCFGSTYMASVGGVGLKLFPAQEMRKECAEMLDALDAKYIVTSEKGIYFKEN